LRNSTTVFLRRSSPPSPAIMGTRTSSIAWSSLGSAPIARAPVTSRPSTRGHEGSERSRLWPLGGWGFSRSHVMR
jgi:hypothetical protein